MSRALRRLREIKIERLDGIVITAVLNFGQPQKIPDEVRRHLGLGGSGQPLEETRARLEVAPLKEFLAEKREHRG